MKVVSDTLWLSIASIASRILLFAREGYLAANLNPSNYGVWVLITLILNYALHLPLGYQNLLSRDVPFYLGRGNFSALSSLTTATQWVTLITACTASIAGVFVTFLDSDFADYRPLSIFIALVVVIQQLNGYQSVVLRAEGKFIDYSAGLLFIALFGLLGAAVSIKEFGLLGPLFFQLLALTICSFFWANRIGKYDHALPIGKVRNILKYSRQAFPLFIGGGLIFIITSLDRVLILSFYSMKDSGEYGFSLVLIQSSYLIVTPIISIFYTRMMREYGLSKTPQTLVPYLYVFSHILPILVVFFLGLVSVISPILIEHWFSDYGSAAEILSVLIFGVAPFLISSGIQMILIAEQREWLVMWSNVISFVIQLIFYGIFVFSMVPLETLAWVVVAYNFLYSIYFITLYRRINLTESFGSLRFLAIVYAPIIAYSLGVFLLIQSDLMGVDELSFIVCKVMLIVLIAVHFVWLKLGFVKFILAEEPCSTTIAGKKLVRNAA